MSEVRVIELSKIEPNKNQPRLDFEDDALKNLASSIKENGLIHPIVVRKVNNGYEIIAGERRYRASKLLNKEKIEAIVVEKDDEESANLALIENMQRADLSAIEEALAIEKIMKSRKLTQAEIAKKLGYRQSTIANKLRLLKLPEYVKTAIARNEITERHGRALLKVSEDKIEDVFNTIIQRGYNVRRTEEYIEALNDRPKAKVKAVSSSVRLGLNTIKQSYDLCRKTGLDADYQVTEYEDEVKVVIRFKK